MSIDQLAERVKRLERNNRNLGCGLAAALLLSVSMGAFQNVAPKTIEADTIRAKAFHVLSPEGKVTGIFYAGGDATILRLGRDDTGCVSLSTRRDEATLTIGENTLENKAAIIAKAGNGTFLNDAEVAGKPLYESALSFKDHKGETRLELRGDTRRPAIRAMVAGKMVVVPR